MVFIMESAPVEVNCLLFPERRVKAWRAATRSGLCLGVRGGGERDTSERPRREPAQATHKTYVAKDDESVRPQR